MSTFFIQPFGVEQLCTIYFALCIFCVHKFKQAGSLWWLLGALSLGALLIVDLSATIAVLPFIVLFAFLDNSHWKKMLVATVLLGGAIFLIIDFWFRHTIGGPPVLAYYAQVRLNARESILRGNELTPYWKLVSAFICATIVIGPAFWVGLSTCWRGLKTGLLFATAVIPVLLHGYFVPLSEAYRQAHLNCVAATIMAVVLIADSLPAVKILLAGSVLHAVMFAKLYAAPVVSLDPFIYADLAPHPAYGGWDYRLISGQIVTPSVFLIVFFVFCLVVIIKSYIKNSS